MPTCRATHRGDPVRIDGETLRILSCPADRRLGIVNRGRKRSFAGKAVFGNDANVTALGESLRQGSEEGGTTVLPPAAEIHHDRRMGTFIVRRSIDIER